MAEPAPEAAAAAARRSYARLIAYLAARTRDLAAAEDALGEAFARALETWPRDGVPRSPEAWLLTVARRAHGAGARRAGRAAAARPEVRRMLDEAAERAAEAEDMTFPDERLKLLFVCAHPAIDATLHTALMLQCVLGLDAARIGRAHLVPPATMGQRLVRAKAKIKLARLRFEVPEEPELTARLAAVLEAIYGAFGAGWEALDAPRRLASEAIDLGRGLREMMPREPEVAGLLALMLYAGARRRARRNGAGDYVPLDEQDTALWDADAIAEADALLAAAGAENRFGRFQCLAAIQSIHAARRRTGRIDHRALDLLYAALEGFDGSVGARVARAAAAAEVHGPQHGLALLAVLSEAKVADYQPYWAVRASLLARTGDAAAARAAYCRAIATSGDPAERRWLTAARARLA